MPRERGSDNDNEEAAIGRRGEGVVKSARSTCRPGMFRAWARSYNNTIKVADRLCIHEYRRTD